MAKRAKRVRIFSALEVANICGVVNQTAINWIKNGHLKAFTTPGGQYRIYAEDLVEFLSSRGMRIPDEIRELVASKVKNVLIVDDDEDLNNMLREVLVRRLEGFDVLQAFDGFEAGKLISDCKPAVVILDINLPGIDGHKLCGRIKADPSLTNPKIVAISGLPDTEHQRELILSEGADVFVEKPLNLDSLVETIQKLTS